MAKARGLTTKEVYWSLIELTMHAETATWGRFNNFLVFNSILVVSWATLWVSDKYVPLGIYSAVCALGVLSGVFWGLLGHRGRNFQKRFSEMAATLETESLSRGTGPMKVAVELRETLPFSFAGSYWILTWGPVVVGVVLHLWLYGYAAGWCFR